MSETRSKTARAAAPGGAAAGGPRPGLALLVLAAAGIALLTLIINPTVIRIRRTDTTAAQPPAPAAPAHLAQPQ
jgi:hypothetical protein